MQLPSELLFRLCSAASGRLQIELHGGFGEAEAWHKITHGKALCCVTHVMADRQCMAAQGVHKVWPERNHTGV